MYYIVNVSNPSFCVLTYILHRIDNVPSLKIVLLLYSTLYIKLNAFYYVTYCKNINERERDIYINDYKCDYTNTSNTILEILYDTSKIKTYVECIAYQISRHIY